MTLKSDAKFYENWSVVSKTTRILWILTWALKILKISTLTGSFCAKYITFDPKKYRGVMFHDTAEWCKIWKLTCSLENDMRSFGKFDFGKWHDMVLESLKIGSLMGSFYPKEKMYELWGVMCHDNKEWCKIWQGIDLLFQNWHVEFDKFWPEHWKVSKIYTLMGSYWTKYIIFELKKVQKSYIS